MLSSTAAENYLSSFADFPSSMVKPAASKKFDITDITRDPKPDSNIIDAGKSSATTTAQPRQVLDIPVRHIRNVKDISSVYTLQEWEGYVISVDERTFTANLIDKTANKSRAEEQIEFDIDDVSEDDRILITHGAIFRWSIGYQKQNGTKRKISEIVFRRLPAWSRAEIKKATEMALSLAEGVRFVDGEIGWD